MSHTIVQIDAFTEQPFHGNPAAVCLLEKPADKKWMQFVAREMNLAETAFLYPLDTGYNLRWFTPVAEVSLCGHATLATAHYLWEKKKEPHDAIISFSTLSGELTARRAGDLIELDFPGFVVEKCADPDALEAVLGASIKSCFIARNRLLVLLESEEAVRKLNPNQTGLMALEEEGVIVTAPASGGDYDFVSRFFAPKLGVNEDPVTGSAHTILAPYWAGELGRNELTGYQASARGGYVKVRVDHDRVHLGGHAVTVLRGELL